MAILRARAALATLLVFALGACGDDDHPVGPDGTFSQQQSVAALNALIDAGNKVFAGTASGSLAPLGIAAAIGGLAPGGISAATPPRPFELSGPCPLGGNISFKGTYSDDTDNSGNGTSTFDLIQTPSGCRANSSIGDITFDGDPSLQVTYSADWVNFKPSFFRWTMKGALRFSGALTGTCAADVAYALDYGTRKYTMTGTMCGNQLRFEGGV